MSVVYVGTYLCTKWKLNLRIEILGIRSGEPGIGLLYCPLYFHNKPLIIIPDTMLCVDP